MENCFGQHGWKEFHRNRKDILAEYDKILEQTGNRPIQVAHGVGVEAYLRKWLSEFLPKKYGITSGYIIPNIYNDSGKIYHYDIIIYDSLESPILWTEGNEDSNNQGKYRAIPAKHVVSVYEVKSRFTKDNVTEALNKLNQTKDFIEQLKPTYSSGIIFIELKEADNNKKSIVKELIKAKDVHGFNGGIVLRYEGDDSCTAVINLFKTDPTETNPENRHLLPIAKPIDSLDIFLNEEGNLTIAEGGGGVKLIATSDNNWDVCKLYGVGYQENDNLIDLSWSRSGFADFCIKLLSSLEGLAHDDKDKPSFGQIFDKVERRKAPLQNQTPQEGEPFVSINLYEGGEHGKKLEINYDEPNPKITFFVSVENKSDVAITISDDMFKQKAELPSGKSAIKPVVLNAIANKEGTDIKDIIREGLKIPYRAVYFLETSSSEKEYFAIEMELMITENEIKITDNTM